MNRPGFTLVELMLATTITCLIAAGVFVFFSGSSQVSREAYDDVTSAMSDRVVREQALFVEARLVPDVRLPCSNLWERVRR